MNQELSERCGLRFVWDLVEPHSPFGREALRAAQPFRDADALRTELVLLRRLLETPALATVEPELNRVLDGLKDIRGSLCRVRDNRTLTLTELFECKGLLLGLESLRNALKAANLTGVLPLSDSGEALQILDPSGERKRSFFLEDTATSVLCELRRKKRETEARLYRASGTEAEELRLRREELCAAEEREEALLREKLSRQLAPFSDALLADCETVGHLDLLLCKRRLFLSENLCIPEIREGNICLVGARNPAVEEALRGTAFVPVSLTLEPGVTVITGANMGGKSVALKTVALNVVLALCGWPVYAERAELPLLAEPLLLAGDAEQAGNALSSFGGEVVALRMALETYGEGSLLLVDEPARGTNPEEGAALVRSLVRYLGRRPGFALLTTHFDGIAAEAGSHYRVAGLRDMEEETLRRELETSSLSGPEIIARHMDYGLIPGHPGDACPRQALMVCRLLGLPEEIWGSV